VEVYKLRCKYASSKKGVGIAIEIHVKQNCPILKASLLIQNACRTNFNALSQNHKV